MSDYVTKKDVEEIVGKAVGKAVEDLSEVIANFANQVDQRFVALETRVDKLDAKFDRLLNTVDAFVKRLDDTETENTARDAQFAGY